MEAVLKPLGHLASRRQLAALGVGRHRIDRALTTGELLPLKPGWVGTTSALQPAIVAILHGTRLTSATALRTMGVWAGEDSRIHMQHRPGTRRTGIAPQTPLSTFTALAAPAHHNGSGIRFHVAPFHSPSINEPDWRVPLADALLRFGKYESEPHVAAALSSAVHNGLLSRAGALAVLDRLPRRLHRLATSLTFLDGSGLETIFRLRLSSVRCRVAQQRQIGRDRVDFVLDECLVVEVDGDEWHDPREDRTRTNRLVRAGFQVLRFGYADVLHRWDATEATIRMALSARPWGATHEPRPTYGFV